MRDEKACRVCRAPLPAAGRGRPPSYCSRACQAKAYRRRKNPPVPSPTSPRRPGRRRQIAEALWRIAADRGLEAASMREIAAEAGVSLRVVQYHFDSKHDLLLAALGMLHVENERRARARMASVDVTSPRALLQAILDEFLPVDEQRLLALRVFAAYFARSLVDPELAAVFLHDEQPLEELVAGVLVGFGGVPDPRKEADLLVSGVTGLGMDVVHGRRALAEVRATIGYHLDRLEGPGLGDPGPFGFASHRRRAEPDPMPGRRFRSRRQNQQSTGGGPNPIPYLSGGFVRAAKTYTVGTKTGSTQ